MSASLDTPAPSASASTAVASKAVGPHTVAPGASGGGAAPTVSSVPTQTELLEFVRRTAADSELVSTLPLDPEGRTWIRLDGPAGSEAWIISWPPGTGTGWHDHGGSYGAFATADGALQEDSLAARLPTEGWKTLELAEGVDRERKLAKGDARAFGSHHVHEVRNESDSEHAVSVHAYYPPLPLMRRYSRTGAVLRLEQVERPQEWQ
ncbi:cysteine dioxygenase [Streptomyces niveus]|uniref:cysteine dioxygenase n=1 Tax=Streptomyces niveus TaxID=193462 RepID=UPI003625F30B